jgi:hypothetical protein
MWRVVPEKIVCAQDLGIIAPKLSAKRCSRCLRLFESILPEADRLANANRFKCEEIPKKIS